MWCISCILCLFCNLHQHVIFKIGITRASHTLVRLYRAHVHFFLWIFSWLGTSLELEEAPPRFLYLEQKVLITTSSFREVFLQNLYKVVANVLKVTSSTIVNPTECHYMLAVTWLHGVIYCQNHRKCVWLFNSSFINSRLASHPKN